MGKSDRKKRTPARGVLFGSTRKSDLFCSQIIVDLVFQNLSVQAVNHSCFFQGLTLCRRQPMQCMPAPIRIPMIFVSIAINSPIVMSFEIFAILKFLL